MLRIALTGGIGCGKSVVGEMFQDLGIPFCDTDHLSRALVAPGQPALQEIVATFGGQVLNADGQLDRQKLSTLIFADQQQRSRLEHILHPRILRALHDWVALQTAPYCVVAVPLLFEAGWERHFDRILVVDCPERLQLERAVARDQGAVTQVQAKINAQIGRRQRLAGASDIIVNDDGFDSLYQQVAALHAKYLELGSRPG